MYAHILIPVALDHNHDATTALKAAERLLAEHGKITLLHVLEELPAYASSYLSAKILEEGEANVAAQLEVLGQRLSTTPTIKVVHGHAATSILDYAQAHRVDCLVMRSHRPELADYLIGSTAARVVRHSVCSVHVIR